MFKLNLQFFGGGTRSGLGGGLRLGARRIKAVPITDSVDEWESGSRMTSPSIEYAAVFDKNGNPIGAYQGDSNSVGLPLSVRDVEGGILTHNHPGMEMGGTFSSADVNLMAKSKLSQIRAVETNKNGKGSKTTYILRATPNANREKLASFVKGKAAMMQRNFDKSYVAALNRAKAGKVAGVNPNSKTQIATYARQYALGKMNNYWKKNVGKFGFEYVVKKSTGSSGYSSKK